MAITEEELQEVIEKGLLVKRDRLGISNQPYEGILKRLPDGTLWFEGKSGGETIEGKVEPREIFLT